MPRSRKSAPSKVTRLQAQTRAIRLVNGLLMCLFGLILGSVVVATSLPQMQQLEEKEAELLRFQAREREVIAEREDKAASVKAAREDLEYLELLARDRLNKHREGETIYRMERDR